MEDLGIWFYLYTASLSSISPNECGNRLCALPDSVWIGLVVLFDIQIVRHLGLYR